MNFQYALLGFLHQAPNYGYGLKKLYDQFFGDKKPVLSGQVYSTLARLERDRKIHEVHDTTASGGPERIKYQITDLGRIAFDKWLITPEAPTPQLTANLYLKTVMAILEHGDAALYLNMQRRAHIGRMRQLINQRRQASIADTLLIDHALFHIEADLRWIELTSSRLTKLKEELCQPNR
jgi:DNA-binding PadR family transcriptional regulator